MLRTALTFAAILCVTTLTIATAQQKPQAAPNDNLIPDARGIGMTIRLIEKNGDLTRVIANPTISAIEGRPFAFMAGGVVAGTSPLLEFGTRIEGTIHATKTKAFAVALKLSQCQLVDTGDRKTKTVRAQSLDTRTELEPSVTRTIQIDDKTSIEITIHDTAK